MEEVADMLEGMRRWVTGEETLRVPLGDNFVALSRTDFLHVDPRNVFKKKVQIRNLYTHAFLRFSVSSSLTIRAIEMGLPMP